MMFQVPFVSFSCETNYILVLHVEKETYKRFLWISTIIIEKQITEDVKPSVQA